MLIGTMSDFKSILIGDPHAKISNLKHLAAVIDFAIANKKDEKAVILLGDLFDTHGVVKNEISYFWRDQFNKLVRSFETVICLVGNHDQVGNIEKEHIHSLWAYKGLAQNLIIVDRPASIEGCLFLPYTSSEDKFKTWAAGWLKAHPMEKIIFCHQTFDGAKYDNGMFAPDGFSLDDLNDRTIISGHIHTQSEFANIWYPGTSLWESASDANKEKGIWRLHVKDNKIINRDFLSTRDIVPEMILIELREGDVVPATADGKKYTFHLVGSSAWISKAKKQVVGHKIKTTYTDSIAKKMALHTKVQNIAEFIESRTIVSDKKKLLSYIESL